MTRDPIDLLTAAGVVLALFLLALMPDLVREIWPADDPLPCPAAFKDPRCTSEMGHAPRNSGK